MPLHTYSNYFQFGTTGHKYYFDPSNARSRILAHNAALAQVRAIEESEHRPQHLKVHGGTMERII
jgi:hypothetical protein